MIHAAALPGLNLSRKERGEYEATHWRTVKLLIIEAARLRLLLEQCYLAILNFFPYIGATGRACERSGAEGFAAPRYT